MSRIVLVHGIAQEFKGAHTLLAEWFPSLLDGLGPQAASLVDRADVSMAFYGDLFRPTGHRGLGTPELTASDVEDGIEADLLLRWWEAAAEDDSRVAGPRAATRLRTSLPVQRALNALSHSAFFSGLSERLMIAAARQVRRYFTEPNLRAAIQQRLSQAVTDRTQVIVAHSLGTIVAYEALCSHPDWPNVTLVTLGSPLGIRNLIFDRLLPSPADGHARWPSTVTSWTNVADRGDVVALAKELSPLFGDRINDLTVYNGAKAHDVRPYLTAQETGLAIANGLNHAGGRRRD